MKVVVLLACYNGEQYIKRQIESIFQQTHQDLLLVVRDDGSVDKTLEIIKQYNDPRIIVLEKESESLSGHVANFSALVAWAKQSDYHYFCFSDQDDIWLPNKIKTTLQALKSKESICSLSEPVLVHTDLEVVARTLEPIAGSFFSYQGLPSPKLHTSLAMLYQNIGTGCTMMFNKALLDIAVPVPKHVPVHDWWFMLCAQYAGRVVFVELPTIKYRQHGRNSIGAVSVATQRNPFKSYLYQALKLAPKNFSLAYEQALFLQQRLGVGYSDQLDEFCSLLNLSLSKRIRLAMRSFSAEDTWPKRRFILFMFIVFPYIFRRRAC